jgi:hypothetical protein
MDRILEMGSLCVCVTFLDELAAYSDAIVSMVSTVIAGGPAERTYEVVRGPADGLAYAAHIARKFRLTYSEVKERIRHESASAVPQPRFYGGLSPGAHEKSLTQDLSSPYCLKPWQTATR